MYYLYCLTRAAACDFAGCFGSDSRFFRIHKKFTK